MSGALYDAHVSDPPADGNGGRRLDLLSVVAPVYNEEATLQVFYARVCSALEGLRFELVLVDDGSSDQTPAILAELAGNDPGYTWSSSHATSATRQRSRPGLTTRAAAPW